MEKYIGKIRIWVSPKDNTLNPAYFVYAGGRKLTELQPLIDLHRTSDTLLYIDINEVEDYKVMGSLEEQILRICKGLMYGGEHHGNP